MVIHIIKIYKAIKVIQFNQTDFKKCRARIAGAEVIILVIVRLWKFLVYGMGYIVVIWN